MPKKYSKEIDKIATGVSNWMVFIGLFFLTLIVVTIIYFFWKEVVGTINWPVIKLVGDQFPMIVAVIVITTLVFI